MAPPRLLSIGLLRAEELAEEQIKAVVKIVSYTTLVSLLLKSIGHTDQTLPRTVGWVYRRE